MVTATGGPQEPGGGTAAEHNRVAERTRRLREAVGNVTLEEFRSEDAHFERRSRLGRELLYLIANNGWCRRTTEVVDVQHAQFVDTDVIVDVDLAYADHEAFELDAGLTWLPLLALPRMIPAPAPDPAGRRRRPVVDREDPDPIASLEVSDASGARVHRLPQAEVHQRLAAALAEIVVNLFAGRGQQQAGPGEMEREDKLLLSAAIRRLLPAGQRSGADAAPGGARPAGTMSAGTMKARSRLDAVLARDIRLAEESAARAAERAEAERAPDEASDGLDPYADSDLYEDGGGTGRLRPVLGSHVGEILDALIGTTFVVVAVEDPGHPISYTVRVPSRRLLQLGRISIWFQPRALLSIDLLAPTTHSDRLIRLTLPDGVVCHEGSAGALGRIDVVLPAPFERLDTLMNRLFPPSLPIEREATWVDGRIAEMALHTVDAALDSLRHYAVTAVRAEGSPAEHPADVDRLSARVDESLRDLRDRLGAIRDPGADGVPAGTGPMDALRRCWDAGSWFPTGMRRRLGVNTASTNLVMMRATAVDEISLRARPTVARIDADVSVSDSPVFNVARYAGALNMTVLLALTVLLVADHDDAGLDAQLLATVLTLFSAVQAGRVEHPDGSTLRGLLSRAGYWIMLASVLPTVLLAMALAVVPAGQRVVAALIALVVQGLLMLRLRQGPLSRWRRDRPARLRLATAHAPDHARVDILRGKRSRALVTEALLLGREAHAFVVTRPAGPGQFTGLLERAQKGGPRPDDGLGRMTARAARILSNRGIDLPAGISNGRFGRSVPGAANLLGVVQSATAGRAMAFLVFRERPAPGWTDGVPAGSVAPVWLDPDRLAPMEPPEWVLEVLIGLPEPSIAVGLSGHPLMDVVTDTQRYNFRVTSLQLPAPPPPGGEGRRWMRMRIGVTYRRGDSLRGLGRFLYRLHTMDGAPFQGGTLRVIVRVNADGPDPGTAPGRPLSDKDFDVVPDEEAAADPSRAWRALAVTANSRVGLLHDVLAGLAAQAPGFELAGMTAAAVYGQTVVFMVGRDRSEPDDEPLRLALPRRLRPSDRLLVAVDQRISARGLDGPAAQEHQLLLRLGVRTPDRPGVLRDTLRSLASVLAEQAPPGVAGPEGVDVWFVQLQVVNGLTTRGRLTLRLPGSPTSWSHWEGVDWAAVQRSVARTTAAAGRPAASDRGGWFAADLDDTVITTELLRTRAGGARAAAQAPESSGISAEDLNRPIRQLEG
jgi:hypothetical protein